MEETRLMAKRKCIDAVQLEKALGPDFERLVQDVAGASAASDEGEAGAAGAAGVQGVGASVDGVQDRGVL